MADLRGPAGSLFMDDGGEEGPAVLFLHSLGGTAAHWSAQLEHLRRAGRRAVGLELRGHGRSDPAADGDYTMPGYASDVVAAADARGIERFVLVGHSMGAHVAAAVAARHSDRTGGLLLVDGAHAREEPTPEEAAWLDAFDTPEYSDLIGEYWETILTGTRPEVRDRVLRDLRATLQRTVAATFRALIAHQPLEDLRRYRGPKAVVLSGIGDNPAAPHRHLPDLSHAKLDRTGHWLHLDRPGDFNDLLDAFLADGRLRSAPGSVAS